MAVPVARTWVDNDSLDTSNLNTGVRDPIEFAKNPPAAVVELSTTQSIPNGVSTPVSFNVEHFDNDAMFTATSTTITISETGLYDIEGFVPYAANATGYRTAEIWVNGALVRAPLIHADTSAATGVTVQIRRSLTAGDTVVLNAQHTSGGALNIGGTTLGRPGLSVCRASGT